MKNRKSERYYEQIGDSFDKWMSDYDVRQRLALIDNFLPKSSGSMSCLEVGCGTGRISQFLAGRVKSLTVTDISGKLAAEVAGRLGTSHQQEDATKLSVGTDAFDLVVSSECIEHTPDPRAALREMARVVRPGGHIIVTSPNKLWYPVLWLSMKLGIRKFQGNEIWLWPKEAAGILKETGCSIAGITGCHLFPWQLPLAKRLLPYFDKCGQTLYPLMINWGIHAVKKN